MTVEIRNIYNPQTGREIYNSRLIVMVGDDGYETNILVGVGNRPMRNAGMDAVQFSASRTYLYQAHIAVIMDFLGNMKIVKNRTGRDCMEMTNLEVRQELWESFQNMGLGYYDTALMMGNFNQVVSEILDEPVLTNSTYPLGINYRDYIRRGIMINKYEIKRHTLV
jgi:hypothetical protein